MSVVLILPHAKKAEILFHDALGLPTVKRYATYSLSKIYILTEDQAG